MQRAAAGEFRQTGWKGCLLKCVSRMPLSGLGTRFACFTSTNVLALLVTDEKALLELLSGWVRSSRTFLLLILDTDTKVHILTQ